MATNDSSSKQPAIGSENWTQSVVWRKGVSEEDVEIDVLKRAAFMDSHNTSPSVLAKVLFPKPVCFGNDINSFYKYCHRQKDETLFEHKTDGTISLVDGVTFSNDATKSQNKNMVALYKALTEVVLTRMKEYKLDVTWIHKHMPLWVATMNKERMVRTPSFVENNAVQLFCCHCMKAGRVGLVMNLTMSSDPTVTNKDLLGYYCLKVDEVYYHSSTCMLDDESTMGKSVFFQNKKLTLFDLVLPNHLMGLLNATYQNVITTINATASPAPYFHPDWKKETMRKEVRKVYKEAGIDIVEGKDEDWKNTGLLINFNSEEYLSDDRQYLHLPENEMRQVSVAEHQTTMAWLGYFFCSAMSCVKDFAPFVFDEEMFVVAWNAVVNRRRFKGFGKKNETFHLQLKEISLLFGGNEWCISGTEPIHQVPHNDIGMDLPAVFDEGRLFPAGSILVPLESSGRSIYYVNPSNRLDIALGHMLFFGGEVEHGGLTHRASIAKRVLLHMHLDSHHVVRTGQRLQFSVDEKFYYPKEHLGLYDVANLQTHLKRQAEHLKQVMESLTKRPKLPSSVKQDMRKLQSGQAFKK